MSFVPLCLATVYVPLLEPLEARGSACKHYIVRGFQLESLPHSENWLTEAGSTYFVRLRRIENSRERHRERLCRKQVLTPRAGRSKSME
jgi:hypothetical protein